MNPTTMLAAVFDRAGEAEHVVQLRPVPIPRAASGEVLVRMQAASLHPADRMFVAGAYRHAPVFPQRAGLVGTGVVVQGDGLQAGTRVAFRHPGAWAEYCAVPEDRLFLVPPAVDPGAASQFALNPVTAWGLLDAARVTPGEWLAVNAPRSNVATMVRALAAARGVRVVEVGRARPEDGDLAQDLLATTGGEPIAALLDAVGGPALVQAVPALRQGAIIVSYGLLDRTPAPWRNADLIYRNLSWVGFGVDHWLAQRASQRETMAQELWDAIGAGGLPIPVRAAFPLERLDAALRADAAGGEGKVVLALGADA